VLALRKQDIDAAQGVIIIKCLKKRGKTVYRSVPVPKQLISTLELVFDLRRGKASLRLWDVTERQGYRWVIEAMQVAKLAYSPRSLRHSFGVAAVVAGVPLTAIQKWLGHADLKTTSIYVQAMGEEERGLAERMWS